VSGDSTAQLLWCIDPVDGTTNFAHNYPCFAVSVAVLLKGRPVAACVVEFVGGAPLIKPHFCCLLLDCVRACNFLKASEHYFFEQ
jgi:hypothetical protein